MPTHRCDYCGGDIIFRYIDGRCTPIHTTGGCSSWGNNATDYVHERPNIVYSYNYNPDDFCRPTSCPHCGQEVFFIRHNGGSVWLDELGWPWPKHACFDNDDSYKWICRAGKTVKLSLLAIVIRAEKRPDKMADRVVVFFEDNRIAFIYISDLKESQKLAGSLAIISQQERIIFPEIGACKVDYIDFGENTSEVKLVDNLSEKRIGARKGMIRCPECNMDVENKHLYFHRVESHQVGLCPICYEIVAPEKLDIHLRENHLITTYHLLLCPMCNARVRSDLLIPHLRAIHDREHCPFCHGFVKASIFEGHLYGEHGFINSYKSKKDNDIENHKPQDQQKMYTCEYCSRSFKKQRDLSAHKYRHHRTGLKAQKKSM